MPRPTAEAAINVQARVPCPARGGASVDVERCFGCAYFNGVGACGTDPRVLIDADQESWRRLLVM